MTNAELITELTYCANIEKRKLLSNAADALEAAEKRIAELEKQEPTEKQVVDYCHKRCFVVIEEELFQRMKSTFSQTPKEGEWIMDCLAPQMDEYRIGEWAYAPKCSECGTHWDAKTNYCPNCGSKMRGANDEQIH